MYPRVGSLGKTFSRRMSYHLEKGGLLKASPEASRPKNAWHDTLIEQDDLKQIGMIGRGFNSVLRVTHPKFDRPVAAKIFRYPESARQHLERETEAYMRLQGKVRGLVPEFLGHVVRGGWLVGHLLDEVEHAREATATDSEACKAALARLHDEVGVLHRDGHSANFLVRGDGSIVILDFEMARTEGIDSAEFDLEISRVDSPNWDANGWLALLL